MIKPTCGHNQPDHETITTIAIKAWEINESGWVKAIHYMTVCDACLHEYKQEDAILNNEYEESTWINKTS